MTTDKYWRGLSHARNAAERADKIESIANQLLADCEKIKSEAAAQRESPEDAAAFPDKESLNAIKSAVNAIRHRAFSLYNIIAEPDTYDGLLTLNQAYSSENFLEDYAVFPVEATVKDGWIFVKTPLLWSRYQGSPVIGKLDKGNYLKWMSHEIEAALLRISDQIPAMNSKNITYLFVIPKGRSNPADSDNYETKHITDIISSYLSVTDGPLCTSFTNLSMMEDVLPSGTYITVSPDHKTPPSLTVLLTRILDAFSVPKTDIYAKPVSGTE